MNNIKAIRLNKKVTQNEIAKRLEIDRSAVAKWESGESLPRADKLPELAKILNCTVDDLLK
nr:MAG TPA: Repressor protein CI [Caudoviricetes sp.]